MEKLSNPSEWLGYENEDVINSFCCSIDISKTEPDTIFKDMIFFW